GDAGVDPGPGVVVQVVAALERVELEQGLFRAAVEEGGLGIGLTRAHRVAGDLAGAGVGLLEHRVVAGAGEQRAQQGLRAVAGLARRSEEHTSELQSRENLVCRLLLEKKKNSSDYRVRRRPHPQR